MGVISRPTQLVDVDLAERGTLVFARKHFDALFRQIFANGLGPLELLVFG